ncbi:hypothetical protein [Streptomyces cavernae]|uniref:hypothetical protein n=1 Tax=Streptomyces cavernae TaxID=2259034 RepID=UPI000FEBD37B|nr:hypothetical protein [Streptomyces cavernae]
MAIELPEDLIEEQRKANAAHAELLALRERFSHAGGQEAMVPPGEWTAEQRAAWDAQQAAWRDLLGPLHARVTQAAEELGASRYQVEMELKQAAKAETVAA